MKAGTSCRVGALALACLLAAAAYGANGRAQLDGCVHAGRHTKIIRFREPGAPRAYATVRAAVIGTGPAGVVFLNQSGGSLCDWLPFAHRLAASGIRSIVFDYGWGDPEDGALGAARALRRRGVRRIVFVGSSFGTRGAVIAGAARRDSAGVVCLSFAMFQPVVQRAARRLRAGVLLVTAENDQFGALEDSQHLYALIPATDKRLLVMPGSAHGIDLLRDAQLRDTVVAWLRDHLHV